MLRKKVLQRWIGSVFAGLAFAAAMPTTPYAQDIPLPPLKDKAAPIEQVGGQGPPPVIGGDAPGKENNKTIVVQINVTKTIGMTRAPGATEDPIIEKVQNENPKVCRVQAIFNDPRHILVTGVSPGTSRITFTGFTDPNMKDRHDEVIEIRVPSDDEPVREQLRKDFLELIKKTVPSANIDAVVAQNNAVFLTGNVYNAADVATIQATAAAIFGPQVNLINGMRVGGVQQVEVDCVICSVNRSKVRSMSFSWSINRPDFFLSSILSGTQFTNAIAAAPAAATANQTITGGNIVFGSITDTGSFFGFLQALRTDGLAKIQAEPKVVTLSGRPAQFVSGGETPILTQTGLGGPSVSYRTFGTTITVLPIVLGNGKIHLEIAPLVSQINAANGVTIAGANGATVVPGFDTQGAQVAIQVEDGQTIAIGGLIQHVSLGNIAKVPVLGDVPFLGAAFRSVSYTDREQELIILVTPRLIDPMACNQMPARYPTKATRAPDDFELYLEGMLELPRGQRQTCGPNGCYQAPHMQGPTAGEFPCGDAGRCNGAGYGIRSGLLGSGCKTGTCSTGTCGTTGCSTAAPCGTCTSKVGTAAPMPLTNMPTAPVHGTVATMPSELPPASVAPVSYSATPSESAVAGPALRLPKAE